MAREKSSPSSRAEVRRSGRAAGSPSPGGVTAKARDLYLSAWRWRRLVEGALKSVELTFTQWLVLQATSDLIRESKNAVNQNAVATRTGLDRMTVSQVMTTLAKLGHVDRGPDAVGRGYRIFVTASGRKALAQSKQRVDAAGEAWTSDERRLAREQARGASTSLPAERARGDKVPDHAPDD
jgi:DNA-binding MarR family transcriptional regulator